MCKQNFCVTTVQQLIKFIKKSEKITNVVLILLHIYIKFQDQNHRNERVIKNKISNKSNLINLSEISLFWYS
jgi:hypothetical protein